MTDVATGVWTRGEGSNNVDNIKVYNYLTQVNQGTTVWRRQSSEQTVRQNSMKVMKMMDILAHPSGTLTLIYIKSSLNFNINH